MEMTLTQLLSAVALIAPDLDAKIVRDSGLTVGQFSSLEQATSGDIAFLANPKYVSQVQQTKATAVVLNEAVWLNHLDTCNAPGVILTNNPYAFFAFASQALVATKQQELYPHALQHSLAIHPSAVIHATAKIGARTSIGPFTVIEAEATIEDDCQIGAHCTIGAGVSIGKGTQLYSSTTVYYGSQIGSNCIIHSGTVIGSDGFGFAPYQKRWIKIPQTGIVRIGDDVEIGSNCAIDRGALGDTVIGRGTKLDNLIQIAHNVQIGEDCAFAANIAIAGSAIVGNRVQMGGKAGVLGHLSVCDDVIISSCTLVTKTIRKPGFYTGVYPIQENAEWEKNAVSLKRLNTLREQVKALEKQIKLG